MEDTETKWRCDKCGKKIPRENELNIVTSLSEQNIGWARLHVVVAYHHGSHNDGKKRPAQMCKTCTLKLLKDAVNRVTAGERASAGTEEVEKEGW